MSATAHAGETFLLLEDRHDLQPPYAQWWYATPSDEGSWSNDGYEVFIRGDGKHGDFFGILKVDCNAPENSEWVATGGFIEADRVPAKAIGALRLKICRAGDPV
jgi:hypothetical protein